MLLGARAILDEARTSDQEFRVRYLLDTSIISELVRPAPQPSVVHWVEAQTTLDLALSVVTLGELEKGIALMPDSPRRQRLTLWARDDVPRQFLGRLLLMDGAIAIAWGELTAKAHHAGRPLPTVDGLMLATASVHNLVLVTRNVSDCGGRGVRVLDPWDANAA